MGQEGMGEWDREDRDQNRKAQNGKWLKRRREKKEEGEGVRRTRKRKGEGMRTGCKTVGKNRG